MKRIIVAMMAVLLSIGVASAQQMSAQRMHGNFRHHSLSGLKADASLVKKTVKNMTANVFSNQVFGKQAISGPRKISASDATKLVGSYLEASYHNMEYYACQDSIEISFPDENTIAITNLQGYGTTVTGTVNWSTGALNFPHQVFLHTIMWDYNPTTGEYDIPVETDMYFDPDSANVRSGVRGQIYEDGTIELGKWLAETYFPEDNCWDWVTDFDMKNTTFLKPNSLMTTTDVKGGTHTYRTYVHDHDDDFSTIFGFAGKGSLYLQRRNNGALIIRPEQRIMFYNFYFGYCSVYTPIYDTADNLTGVNRLKNIEGHGTATEWNIGEWCCTFDLATRMPEEHDPEWKTKSTKIVRTDGQQFTYPAAKDFGWEGEGSEAKPYLLKTAQDFVTLNDVVQTGEYFDGMFFAMANDVDFTGSNFKGVATGMLTTVSTNPRFAGTLDGRGFRIKNLKIIEPELNHIGLFGELRGHVKNLIMDETCQFLGYDYVGSIAGEMKYSLDCSMIGCENYSSVTGVDAYVGGLAGQTAAGHIIQNCYNAGTVTGANCKVGGLVGYLFRSKMMTSQNAGLVQIKNDYPNNDPILAQAGGLAGYACGITVENCLNSGTIDGAIGTKIGGLFGEIYNGLDFDTYITNCVNIGSVMSYNQGETGGITAYNTCTVAHVTNCYYDASRMYVGGWNGGRFDGINAATTQDLISGSTSKIALPTRIWSIKEGYYPSLKVFEPKSEADPKNEDWRQCYVLFAENESAGNLQTVATINADKAELKLAEPNCFKLEDMKVYGPTMMGQYADTLYLTKGKHNVVMPLRKLIGGEFVGDGTEANPYQIGSVDEWLILVRESNINGEEFEGKFIKITADIDFKDADFIAPYSDCNQIFKGTLDGDGHTLSNINMDLGMESGSKFESKGLIATVGPEGTVKNLTIDNSYFHGFEYIGSFVGLLQGKLENCHTTKTVLVEAENRFAGGLVGNMEDGTVENCSNSADVWSEQFVGGIAGDARSNGATIRYTQNYGHIYNFKENRVGVSNVAGFVARMNGRIISCRNYGTIESDDDYAAGFASQGYSSTEFRYCYNYGEVTAHAGHRVMGYAAGICADMGAARVTGCGNAGRVISHLNYAGGIAALCEGTITDSWNTGMVTADICFAGGIIGYTTIGHSLLKGSFTRCWNAGEVVAGFSQEPATESNFAGGIIGNTIEETPWLDECWNMGYVHVDKNPGPDGTSDYDAAFDFTNAGGLVGGGAPVIKNCANFGKVQSKKQTGGLLGRLIETGYGMIQNSYNTGVVLCPGEVSYTGHIMGDEFIDYSIDSPSVFYDADATQQNFALDAYYNGLSREDMTATSGTITALGSKFDFSGVASYPQLKSFMTDTDANHLGFLHHQLATATIIEDEESSFLLGNAKTVQWQGENIIVKEGIAFGTKEGNTTLKATVEDVELSKEFAIEITHAWTEAEIDAYLLANGISSVAGKSANGKSYNLAGQQVGKTYHGIIVRDGKKILK